MGFISRLVAQGLLEELSNVHDVAVTVAHKSGGNSSVDAYINATLWTVVFVDPVGDVPRLEVRCAHLIVHGGMIRASLPSV